jgi:hypothetical protein
MTSVYRKKDSTCHVHCIGNDAFDGGHGRKEEGEKEEEGGEQEEEGGEEEEEET